MLRDGVPVEYRRDDGSIAGDHVRLIDFDNPDANDWLAVNQFTVIEGQNNRRPDIVVFVNGLPLGIIELKNSGRHRQMVRRGLQPDPDLQAGDSFVAALQRSDWWSPTDSKRASARSRRIRNGSRSGARSKASSMRRRRRWSWRRSCAACSRSGAFSICIRNFIVFEEDPDTRRSCTRSSPAITSSTPSKRRSMKRFAPPAKIRTRRKQRAPTGRARCKAARKAIAASASSGTRRVPARAFDALLRRLHHRHPAMENPTLVVLTDRNDLDDQLFGQFQRCHEILRQTPVQAESVEHLRELLNVASGGVVFTTIQKFMPEEKGGKAAGLSKRRNIVVIADEAHRSQYDLIDGLARNLRDSLPNASFIGFTGTPIEKTDANTRAVFGDYISIYDIQRAVADKATVPIYYESRVAKLGLNASELPKIDEEFEEITEGEELTRKEKLKTKWAALEALVGNPKRIDLIAADLVKHYERRLEAMEGKAMIVCMSRRICVDLYNAIIKLRPEWASGPNDDDELSKSCVAKIVMTGSAEDGPDWQPHIRNKEKRRKLADALQGSERPVPHRDRARHVADRLRRAVPAARCMPTSRCAATGSCRPSRA